MKIFLEAFVDTNFGDNLFIHTLVRRYPMHTFYLVETEGFEASYQLLVQKEANVRVVPREQETAILREMEGMLIVGGDMFFDGSIYRKTRRRIRGVKKQGGFVIFLGLSLFPGYCLRSRLALRRMFRAADQMVVREQQTYAQILSICPTARVRAAADMAFATEVEAIRREPTDPGVLGISVRRKIQKGCDTYESYSQRMAETASAWLAQNQNHRVEFLALSCGVFDDRQVAAEIMQRCSRKEQERMSCTAFEGDVEAYIRKMQTCGQMVCTRFHALVFAILLKKPFVPVVYEEKMNRLLDEIGYQGLRPHYEELPKAQEILDAVKNEQTHTEQTAAYLDKAGSFFREVDVRLLG